MPAIDLSILWRGLLAGGVLGRLRAMGDLGVTLIVAGNIPGRTQTMSKAIYEMAVANDILRANKLASSSLRWASAATKTRGRYMTLVQQD